MFRATKDIASRFDAKKDIVVYTGDCLDLLRQVPNRALQLVVTSPPYNIGKEYEKRLDIDHYVEQQAAIITECVRALSDSGSICWQVGNFVDNGAIFPLDSMLYPIFRNLGLQMRNRIIWHFEPRRPLQNPPGRTTGMDGLLRGMVSLCKAIGGFFEAIAFAAEFDQHTAVQ